MLSPTPDNTRYEKAAKKLPSLSIVGQRKFLIGHKAAIQVNADTVQIRMHLTELPEPITISVVTKLVRKGSELRLAIAPDNGQAKHEPDPVLLRLIAQAFAARDLIVDGQQSPIVSDYSKRHLNRLAKLSYLAPDIIKVIVQGSQPVSLTGRKLLRAGTIPLAWDEQRAMFGLQ